MILHRLEVLNFGRFASGQWEFSEGINVVQGPNEAGKSTLAEAIAKALLGSRDVSTTAADYREWKTWGREDMFVLRAEFSHRGERWRVTRDFVEGKEILENLHTGERIRTRVRQRLAEMVGLQPDRSEAQYLATAYLRQGEWETVAEAETIKDIVTNVVLLGAGGPNPRKLLQDLRKRRAEHMRGATGRTADKNPGPIALARARVQQLEEEVARLEAEAQKEENARKQLHAAQEELRSVRSKLDQLEKRLEAAKRRRELEGEKAAAERERNALTQTIAKAREYTQQVRDGEADLADLPDIKLEDVSALQQKAEQAKSLRQQAEEERRRAAERRQLAEQVRAKMAGLPEPPPESEVEEAGRLDAERGRLANELREAEERARSAGMAAQGRRRVALVLALLGVAAAAVAVFAPLPAVARMAFGAAGGVLVVAGAAILATVRVVRPAEAERIQQLREELGATENRLRQLLAKWQCENAVQLAQKRAAAVGQRAQLEAELRQRETEAEAAMRNADEKDSMASQIEAEVAETLRQWATADLNDARQKAEKRRNIEHELSEARARLSELLGDRSIEELQTQLVQVEAKVRAVEQELQRPEMMAAAITDQEFGELQQEEQRLEERERELSQQVTEAGATIRAFEGAALGYVSAEQNLEEARKKYAHEERYGKVLSEAEELLDKAIGDVCAAKTEAILPTAAQLLSKLTLGRYDTLDLGDGQVRVQPPELGELVAIESGSGRKGPLSYATREQVYLSLRLAMYLTLWPEEGPPLILDEPLLAFDGQRTAAALEVLRDISHARQVIILTATDEYDAISSNTIRLSL